MPESFVGHPLEREGFIRFKDSIPKVRSSKTKGFDDIQYFLLDPHGSENLGATPREAWRYMPSDKSLVQTFARYEKDGAMPELGAEILRQKPFGLACHVDVARILFDANRHPRYALGHIIKPSAPESVKMAILAIHKRVLDAIDDFMGRLPQDAKVILLHSMRPNEEIRDTGAMDLSTEEAIREYMAIQDASVGVGTARDINIITGNKSSVPLDDPNLREALQDGFTRRGIQWKLDIPYFSTKGVHKTGDYMEARPEGVVCIDIPADRLCHGSARHRTFKHADKRAHPEKIESMAKIFSEALHRCLRRV